MVTPAIEDIIRHTDVSAEAEEDIERYISELKEELGISGGTLDTARGIWHERFDVWAKLEIYPFEWRGIIRYQIAGVRGAWGRESALLYGEAIAREMGYYDIAETLLGWYEKEFL